MEADNGGMDFFLKAVTHTEEMTNIFYTACCVTASVKMF